jgi:hypothetical protein
MPYGFSVAFVNLPIVIMANGGNICRSDTILKEDKPRTLLDMFD